MTNVHRDGPGRQGRGLEGGALGQMASGARRTDRWPFSFMEGKRVERQLAMTDEASRDTLMEALLGE